MPTPTPAMPVRQSGAALGAAAARSDVIEISGGGRTAVGDRRPAAKPAGPVVSATPAPVVAKPAKMGCSGYRMKYGTSDEAIVTAIREHASKCVAETEGSLWIGASALDDSAIIGLIAWSITPVTAINRVQKHLSDANALTQPTEPS